MSTAQGKATMEEIADMEKRLKAIYAKAKEKGATMPKNLNMENLPATILSIGG